ncbi:hypothetical protein BT63DRAFT_408528 [Microthyrium microscopicum]|uniref:Trichothecene 3-O-acetyltransferase n=1 Tax=Microthyrium microscopicum TaxID=703497 RepID=A0A6A6UTE1_9PEZI|nr:hypothetical protein BT63DRAFT_408528 [Microthyrium microscopicum]
MADSQHISTAPELEPGNYVTFQLSVIDQTIIRQYSRCVACIPLSRAPLRKGDTVRELTWPELEQVAAVVVNKFKVALVKTFERYPELAGHITLDDKVKTGKNAQLRLPIDKDGRAVIDLDQHISQRFHPEFIPYNVQADLGMPNKILKESELSSILQKSDLSSDKPTLVIKMELNFIFGAVLAVLSLHHVVVDGTGIGLVVRHFADAFRSTNGISATDALKDVVGTFLYTRNIRTTAAAASKQFKKTVRNLRNPRENDDLDFLLNRARNIMPLEFRLKEHNALREKVNSSAASWAIEPVCPEFATAEQLSRFSLTQARRTPMPITALILVLSKASVTAVQASLQREATELGMRTAFSTFDVLCAIIWAAVTKARHSLEANDEYLKSLGFSSEIIEETKKTTKLGIPIDIRKRIGLDPFYIGNAALYTLAELRQSTVIKPENLLTVAHAIRQANNDFDETAVRARIRYLLNAKTTVKPSVDSEGNDMWITSWAGLGRMLDFGRLKAPELKFEVEMGHPKFFRKLWGAFTDGSAVVLPQDVTIEDAPFEVFLQLREDVMEALKVDQELANLDKISRLLQTRISISD